MRKLPLAIAGIVSISLITAIWAQNNIFADPGEDQTSEQQARDDAQALEQQARDESQALEQQARDESECRTWASQQTGYDPSYASDEQTAGKGKVAKNTAIGALGGAAGGALLGEVIGSKPGIGALAGGALGGFIGNRKGQKSKAEAQAAAAARPAEYNRALSACLKGRGYSVS